ncbi:hypothetical protein P4N68_09355 [Corynebacterium felinum]|uniref:Uncharacterized protein n=1 Tax=Corynebacterium felinum TaxID=131318 RepID=A0ABU2BAS2_9CORY|nr:MULTISPECIES: hypothetical protein [Corynebacterium]MDF5821281.1 hypothetical protein [Corynebacterium felinum]MDO4762511.1 hypothetical protein [Corynebacterium sp.]MDR7354838.1 hypothetical protein [Corynebacterium felinum]WJY94198.1 hypothetical protein CFELI_02780 [Corynebacterium felinum]
MSLNISPVQLRGLLSALAAQLDVIIDAPIIPGEQLDGVGEFIGAFNSCAQSLARRGRAQCAYVESFVDEAVELLHAAESIDADTARRLGSK